MWDILAYVESEVSLLLKQRENHYVFKYPWREPKSIPALLTTPRSEAINVPGDRLLMQLIVRSRICALDHVCSLARGALKGTPADSERQLITEALKFALRRKKMGLIPATEFIRMLTSCAIISVIPDSFWNACSGEISHETLEKLQGSLLALEVLHPRNDEWLEEATEYLGRIMWAQNNFQVIENTCRQLAFWHSKSAVGDLFAELRKKSTSMIQREEIEKDLLNQKPWQRSALPAKKSIRIGPQSKTRAAPTPETTEKKQEEEEGDGSA